MWQLSEEKTSTAYCISHAGVPEQPCSPNCYQFWWWSVWNVAFVAWVRRFLLSDCTLVAFPAAGCHGYQQTTWLPDFLNHRSQQVHCIALHWSKRLPLGKWLNAVCYLETPPHLLLRQIPQHILVRVSMFYTNRKRRKLSWGFYFNWFSSPYNVHLYMVSSRPRHWR